MPGSLDEIGYRSARGWQRWSLADTGIAPMDLSAISWIRLALAPGRNGAPTHRLASALGDQPDERFLSESSTFVILADEVLNARFGRGRIAHDFLERRGAGNDLTRTGDDQTQLLCRVSLAACDADPIPVEHGQRLVVAGYGDIQGPP